MIFKKVNPRKDHHEVHRENRECLSLSCQKHAWRNAEPDLSVVLRCLWRSHLRVSLPSSANWVSLSHGTRARRPSALSTALSKLRANARSIQSSRGGGSRTWN